MHGTVQSNSANIKWRTPKGDKPFGRSKITLNKLIKEYNLLLDPCCSGPEDAMCENYFTPKEDGLKQPWKHNSIFNPPYAEPVETKDGKTKMVSVIDKWCRKAMAEALEHQTVNIGILPAYLSSDWYHDFVWDILPKDYIIPIRGRVRYEEEDGAKGSPNFDTFLAIWDASVK